LKCSPTLKKKGYRNKSRDLDWNEKFKLHWIGRWVLGRDFYSEFFGSFVMQMEAT